jgi:hypothetical protein
MSLDDLPSPMDRSLSLLRTTRCSVVCDLVQMGPCSETDDAGIVTARPPRLGSPLSRVHFAVLVVVVVVVAVAVAVVDLAVR